MGTRPLRCELPPLLRSWAKSLDSAICQSGWSAGIPTPCGALRSSWDMLWARASFWGWSQPPRGSGYHLLSTSSAPSAGQQAYLHCHEASITGSISLLQADVQLWHIPSYPDVNMPRWNMQSSAGNGASLVLASGRNTPLMTSRFNVYGSYPHWRSGLQWPDWDLPSRHIGMHTPLHGAC